MQNVKMIVTDLDGTLLDLDKSYSLNVKNYLAKLKDEGILIVLATGRILDSAIDVTDGAEFASYIIASNGCIVYDMKNKKEIQTKNIPMADVIKLCRNYFHKTDFIDICNRHYYNNLSRNETVDEGFTKKIRDVKTFFTNEQQVTLLGLANKNKDALMDIYNEIEQCYPEYEVFIMQDSFSDNKWVEVMPKNVNKISGIKSICEIENIDLEDVLAFGDGLNDVEMIQNVGIGVAMGNSLDELKSNAKYVAPSHREDGVYKFLKEHFDVLYYR